MTEEALELAEQAMDYHSIRIAEGNLAHYLAERAKEDDLEKALKLCQKVEKTYEIIVGREQCGFLDTYALVLLENGTKDDVILARKTLERAKECDPQNPYVHEVYGRSSPKGA